MAADEGIVQSDHFINLILRSGDFFVQRSGVTKDASHYPAVADDSLPVFHEDGLRFEEKRLDLVLCQRWRTALLAFPVFPVAAPDDFSVWIV